MTFHNKRKRFPENVIPERVPAKPPLLPAMNGAYVFPNWQNPRPEFGRVPRIQCLARNPWDTIVTDDRHMALGDNYNEADPPICAVLLADLEQAGFDFVVYQLEWAHEHTQPQWLPDYRPVLDSPLLMSHRADNHPANSRVKFCIDLWDVSAYPHMWTDDTFWQELVGEKPGERWTAQQVLHSYRLFAREVAARYMWRESYLTIDGRPVLMRGAADNLLSYAQHFGVDPLQLMTVWRDEIRAVTGKELYLIATNTADEVRPRLKQWTFNGFTDYLLHGHGWDDTMGVYRWHWAQNLKWCKAAGLDYWIPGTGGYDSAAWGNLARDAAGKIHRHIGTAAQFTNHVREVIRVSRDNSGTTRAFSVFYADGEIGEGGIIGKMKPKQLHDGDEMLRAFAAAVA